MRGAERGKDARQTPAERAKGFRGFFAVDSRGRTPRSHAPQRHLVKITNTPSRQRAVMATGHRDKVAVTATGCKDGALKWKRRETGLGESGKFEDLSAIAGLPFRVKQAGSSGHSPPAFRTPPAGRRLAHYHHAAPFPPSPRPLSRPTGLRRSSYPIPTI